MTLNRDGKIAVASSVTVFCGFNSVLLHWFSEWTPLSTEKETSS